MLNPDAPAPPDAAERRARQIVGTAQAMRDTIGAPPSRDEADTEDLVETVARRQRERPA